MAVAGSERAVTAGRLSLTDRLREAMAQLVASPRFQDWAGRFPLTRPLARGQAEALFDLSAGFIYTQVLFAFVETGLLAALRAGPQSPRDLAGMTALQEAALDRLLRGALALGLVSRRSRGRFGLGLRGAALAGNPGAAAMIRHHRLVYEDLTDPVALLRGTASPTRTRRFWSYLEESLDTIPAEAAAEYSELMAVSQALVADLTVQAFPFRNHRRILDVGGGTGTFLSRVAEAAPKSELTLFDLPAVVGRPIAEGRAGGPEQRIDRVGGDFFSDALPPGQDLITLVRVIYDHDDDRALKLLRACRAALAQGGSLLIAEPLSASGTLTGPGATERIADAYFGFYLLAMGSGKTRSREEHAVLLRKAGFSRVRCLDTRLPGLIRLVLGTPRARFPTVSVN